MHRIPSIRDGKKKEGGGLRKERIAPKIGL